MKKIVLISLFILLMNKLYSQPATINHNGQNIFVSGMNLAWMNFANDPGSFNSAQFTQAVNKISAAGGNAMRWWIHVNGTNNPIFGADGKVSGIKSSDTINIKKALDIAYAKGVLVDLCLWSYGMLDTLQTSNKNYILRNKSLLTDTAYTNAYIKKALIPMVKALKNHPGILCWEVFNEPEGMSTQFGWSSVKHVDMKYIQQVVNLVAGAIHREDPNAAVSNGAVTIQTCSDVDGYKNYYRKDKLIAQGGDTLGYLDFYMVHYYTVNGTQFSPFHKTASHWKLDKPLVIAEFPALGFPAESPKTTPEEAYEYAYNNGYAGAMSWTYSNLTTTGGDKNGSLADCASALLNLETKHPEYILVQNGSVNNPPAINGLIPEASSLLGKKDTLTIGPLSNWFSDTEDGTNLTYSVNNTSSVGKILLISGVLKIVNTAITDGIYTAMVSATDKGGKYNTAPFVFSVIDSTEVNRLKYRNTYASSVESFGFQPSYAVDDSLLTTRWLSENKDNQWLLVKLGKLYKLQQMLIHWDAKFALNYEIQVSTDSANWSKVYTEKVGDGGYDKIIFNPINAKFVKVNCITSGTNLGFSISNIEAYTDKSANQSPYIKTHTADRTVLAGSVLKISLKSAYADDDIGERLFYSFNLQSGAQLPSWLKFSDTTKILQGTPSNNDTGSFKVIVTVKDIEGAQVQDSFSITVNKLTLAQQLFNQDRPIVYPNPCGDQLNIKLPSDNPSNTDITVYNAIGAIIWQQKFAKESNLKINSKNYFPGNYFIKVINGNGVYFSKFVKQ
jgi:hypothetical protein